MRMSFGDVELDTEARLLQRGGVDVPLSTKAFDLLMLLIENRPRVLSKRALLEALWPKTIVSEGTLTVLMAEVRKALGATSRGAPIRTVHGVGYAFSGAVRDPDAPAPEAELVLRLEGRELPLRAGENLLGRDRACSVRVDRETVSRRHARILVRGGDATLEDLGSKNGTFVADARLTGATTLRDGDFIGLGSVRLRYAVRLPQASTRTEGGP